MSSPVQLNVYVSHLTPRVIYAFRLLFETTTQLPYQLCDNWTRFQASEGPRLQYSKERHSKDIEWLPASGFLLEEGIEKNFRPATAKMEGEVVLFPLDAPGALLPFDLPAMAFYLASRYEEYQPFTPDDFGRFPPNASIAYREGFLSRPVVNIWGIRLAELLQIRFPGLERSLPAYQFLPTFDIDIAWAYQQRSFLRTLGGVCREALQGRWGSLYERTRVLLGKEKDPFFVFDYLEQQLEGMGEEARFFFLMGDRSRYDKNIRTDNTAFQKLLTRIASQYKTGIHPSYLSNNLPGQLEKEIGRLEQAVGKSVVRSRQHFLMLQFPATYHRLIQSGIQEDYTMGYPDEVGFRASLASPFPWYDLERECIQPLIVHPFMAMDVSLRIYKSMEEQEALAAVKELCEISRSVGGQFCILWHNSSFSAEHGWEGWDSVFEKILSFAQA